MYGIKSLPAFHRAGIPGKFTVGGGSVRIRITKVIKLSSRSVKD